jgi:hypothetical protein
LAAPQINASSLAKMLFFEPLRIAETELPPNILLLAKVLTLAFIVTGQVRLLSWHFLPFLPFFDHLGSPTVFHWTLVTVFLGAAAALFYNKRVSICCLLLGGVILISLLSSRTYFENNRTYCACLLILAGLCTRRQSPWPIRLQVVLVYFGAALNKILQTDWRSGQFFAYWFGHIHHPQMWAKITAFIPAMPLAKLMCWATIAIELALVVGFLVRKWFSRSIWLGAAYHTTLLLLMNTTFGMFYYAMLASYLAFVEWPAMQLEVRYDPTSSRWDGARRILARLDTARVFRWVPYLSIQVDTRTGQASSGAILYLRDRDKSYFGFDALKRILLFTPFTYVCYVILLGRQPVFFQYHRWLAAAALVIFTPFISRVGPRKNPRSLTVARVSEEIDCKEIIMGGQNEREAV